MQVSVSEEILFETPFDELKEIISAPKDYSQRVKIIFHVMFLKVCCDII